LDLNGNGKSQEKNSEGTRPDLEGINETKTEDT